MNGKDKIPPQNVTAEQSVLGAMLIEKDAIAKTINILRPESFYRDAHRYIYEIILLLFEKGEPVDVVTITEKLHQENKLDLVGGSIYLTDLINSVPTAANVEYYAKITEEKAILRKLIEAGSKIAGFGFEEDNDVEFVLDQAETLIFEIAQKRIKPGFVPIKDILKHTLDRIDHLYERKETITGMPTGFVDLDNITAGFQFSDLIIVAARPSVGKTALCLNIAQNAAIKHNIPIAVFSLEMAKEQLVQRLLCAEAEIDAQRLRTATLHDHEWKKLTRAIGRLSEAPIFIDDTPSLSAIEIRAKTRRLQLEHNVGMVIVDYLQLMQGRSRAENRTQEISDIARSLKTLGRELNVPVVAVSQLSRAVEMRQDRIPRLSDLRESGEIEQTADVVLFIHRDDYYNPGSEKGNVAEIIIAKQRNGPTGSIELVFRKEMAKFCNKEKLVS